MKSLLAYALVIGLASTSFAADKPLPRSTPETQGISSNAVAAFLDDVNKNVDSLHSFMLVRHGHVVAEGWWGPYDAKTRHELYSLSKSFTSTAVGLAVAEGKLSIDDPVLKFFADDAPKEPSANLKNMRVRDLLAMNTGHQTEPRLMLSKDSWVKAFLAAPVEHKPGTHFLYNTAATYMQSAIVQKVTGQKVHDYLKPRLYEPLGIDGSTWGESPQGVTLGGYGLSVRTEDIAKFGQLYLQKGKWNGKQLVPTTWVEMATSKQTSNGSNPASDWDQGYGFQFWRCRHGAYRGDGAFGQYCIVMPEQDAVIAITSGLRDMQAVLTRVWDHLLPAMKAEAMPLDSESHQKLQTKLASLTVPVQKGVAGAKVPSVSKAIFQFATNPQRVEALGIEVEGDAVTLVGKVGGEDVRIACGAGEWKKGRFAFNQLRDQPAAASGAWTADNVYTAKICFHETPFVVTLKLDFADGKLKLDASQNVAFGNAKFGQLVGERK